MTLLCINWGARHTSKIYPDSIAGLRLALARIEELQVVYANNIGELNKLSICRIHNCGGAVKGVWNVWRQTGYDDCGDEYEYED